MADRTVFEVPFVMGAPRHRCTRSGRMYMPTSYRQAQEAVRAAYEAAGGENHGGSPMKVRVDVYRPLPKSRPKRVDSEPDTVRPDCDNIAKLVLDSLNGVAYRDDASVVVQSVEKHPRKRGQKERSVVTVEAVAE